MIVRSRARSSVVEQLAFNQLVVGSIPTGLTTLVVSLSGCHVVERFTERTRRTVRMRGGRSEADEAYKPVRRGGRASPTKQTGRYARPRKLAEFM